MIIAVKNVLLTMTFYIYIIKTIKLWRTNVHYGHMLALMLRNLI
jgi:hypothetical protein